MQMAQVEPSRSCINALLLVFENAGRSKQVGCYLTCCGCRFATALKQNHVGSQPQDFVQTQIRCTSLFIN